MILWIVDQEIERACPDRVIKAEMDHVTDHHRDAHFTKQCLVGDLVLGKDVQYDMRCTPRSIPGARYIASAASKPSTRGMCSASGFNG